MSANRCPGTGRRAGPFARHGSTLLGVIPVLAMLGAGACAPPHGGASMVRHHHVMHNGLGPEYEGMRNPLPASEEHVQAGRRLFRTTCVACHGERGRGGGPAAASLDPAPGNVARAAKMRMATDGYLFWAISEGGRALGTQMPAFGDSLEDQQIWQLILYLRAM